MLEDSWTSLDGINETYPEPFLLWIGTFYLIKYMNYNTLFTAEKGLTKKLMVWKNKLVKQIFLVLEFIAYLFLRQTKFMLTCTSKISYLLRLCNNNHHQHSNQKQHNLQILKIETHCVRENVHNSCYSISKNYIYIKTVQI